MAILQRIKSLLNLRTAVGACMHALAAAVRFTIGFAKIVPIVCFWIFVVAILTGPSEVASFVKYFFSDPDGFENFARFIKDVAGPITYVIVGVILLFRLINFLVSRLVDYDLASSFAAAQRSRPKAVFAVAGLLLVTIAGFLALAPPRRHTQAAAVPLSLPPVDVSNSVPVLDHSLDQTKGWIPPSATELTKFSADEDAKIVQMSKAHIPDDIIIDHIQSENIYRDDPADLISLKKDGVSNKVLEALFRRGRNRNLPMTDYDDGDSVIVGMSKAQISDDVIVSVIRANGLHRIDPADLITLRKNGVSNKVLAALVDYRIAARKW